MKILHLARLYAPHIGGVETHVQALNQRLLRDGHQVSVITEQFDLDLLVNETIEGVRVRRLPKAALSSKTRTWQTIWQLRKEFVAADVVHVHDVWWWLLPVLPWVEDKVFTTFHGWETQYPVRWQAKLQRWVYAQLSVGTLHVGDWIREFYWDRPSAVTYGGVDPALKARLEIPKAKKLKAVFVGRLSADNDVLKVIEAVKILKDRDSLISMTWIGDGELKAECQKVGRVTGLISNITSVIKEADLVFASSYLSMLQAQVLGKVVVAFYTNRLKRRYLETYPGFASLIADQEPTHVIHQVIKLLQEPSRWQQLITEGQAIAQAQTWEKVLNQYYQLWKKRHET